MVGLKQSRAVAAAVVEEEVLAPRVHTEEGTEVVGFPVKEPKQVWIDRVPPPAPAFFLLLVVREPELFFFPDGLVGLQEFLGLLLVFLPVHVADLERGKGVGG